MGLFEETIVAVATPAGRGGIGVVRVSGPEAVGIVSPLVRLRRPLAPGRARFGEIVDRATGEVLDEAVVTYFAGPRSYTGEDVVEIAAHGAPVLLEYLLTQCCAAGARLAEAGEFTRRAFLSGRIDLTQAEAVGDLIEAGTLEQARVAARQLGGSLAREVRPAKEALLGLIAEMEAGIDFAEDDIAVIGAGEISERIGMVEEPLKRLQRSFAYARVMREGLTLALVGRPNAGKSSLFNRLLERERAIVTATPGTTRDTVAERMSLGGIPVELVDTAGLRGSTAESAGGLEEAERMGIARSREAMAEAKMVLLVVDARQALDPEDVGIMEACVGRTMLLVVNKMDLVHEAAGETRVEGLLRELGWAAKTEVVKTSAMTDEGVQALREAILTMVKGADQGSAIVTNVRQQQAIARGLAGLGAARAAAWTGVPHEMVLLDLYEGLGGLDELTGETSTEEVLQLIFGRFCIGK